MGAGSHLSAFLFWGAALWEVPAAGNPVFTWRNERLESWVHLPEVTKDGIGIWTSSVWFWSPCSLTVRLEWVLLPFGFPCGSDGKASACNMGDLGSIPGSGRSSGEENGNPLQYLYLENPMDGGTWYATVHVVTKNQTWLSDFTFPLGKRGPERVKMTWKRL